MSNNELRLKILQYINDAYEKNSNQYTDYGSLLRDLNINDIELKTNIEYLDDNNLIDVTYFDGGEFVTKITSNGIDAIEDHEKNVKENLEATNNSSWILVKSQTIWALIKKSWKFLLALLALIVLASDAINGWPIITEFINSSLS